MCGVATHHRRYGLSAVSGRQAFVGEDNAGEWGGERPSA